MSQEVVQVVHYVDPDPPPEVPVVVEPPCPWNSDMEKCPKDGRLVLLTEDLAKPDGIRAVWYVALGTSRPWKKPDQGWLEATLRQWVSFTPAGWALPE